MLKQTGLLAIVLFFITGCQIPNSAQDVGGIDRTQPNKIEKSETTLVWDTPSDPDQTDTFSDNDDNTDPKN